MKEIPKDDKAPVAPAPDPGSTPGGDHAWLEELARQLDSAITEDPQKRSAGTHVVRALIKKALKGDVRAIQACLMARRRYEEAERRDAPRHRGRPSTKVDLGAVERHARLGMRDLSKIARVLGIPKQTLLGPKHGPAVREAFETGRALFERDALLEYADALAHGQANPLLVLKVKQIGWSDRLQVVPPGTVADSAVVTMSDEELKRFLKKAVEALDEEREGASLAEGPASATSQPGDDKAPAILPMPSGEPEQS